MSQHMAEDVAPGTDGFDSHVCQCQQKVEGEKKKNVRHELYVYCHFFKGWLPALVPTSVLLRFCEMPSCAQRA